jgi:hypothetical protein
MAGNRNVEAAMRKRLSRVATEAIRDAASPDKVRLVSG